MAFCMFLGETLEPINHHEEYLLVMAAAHPRQYPVLASVWQRFYDDPIIAATEANAIVHELIMLLAANHADRALTQLIVRLLPFFSEAYRTNAPIRCASD
jgi:hypothetical protein